MRNILLILTAGFLCSIYGCTTMEHRTLPANQEKIYDFSAYKLVPPQNAKWRYLGSDKDLQSVAFINSAHYSRIFIWITPVLKDYSEDETAKNAIDFFQNKTLKHFKLSPDVKLTDQSIQKYEEKIGDRNFKVLKIDYQIKEKKFQIIQHYFLNEKKDLIYNFTIWKELKDYGIEGWEEDLKREFEEIAANMALKNPSEDDMDELRLDYAISDFNENMDDRYISDKVKGIAEKYRIAEREAQKMIERDRNNYAVYAVLGSLASFNDVFEKYGKGFDAQKAIGYYQKALSIRPHCKAANEGLARLYAATKQTDKAIEYFESTILISPNDENLYYELGKIYEEKGDKKKAKEYYQKVIRYGGSGFATLSQLEEKIKNW